MKEGEKVLEVEPGHANEAVEKPDAIKLDIVYPNKCFNITNGKVVIVGDGIATKGV